MPPSPLVAWLPIIGTCLALFVTIAMPIINLVFRVRALESRLAIHEALPGHPDTQRALQVLQERLSSIETHLQWIRSTLEHRKE